MNGKDLMESMSFVDEKYIAQAEELPQRHVRWKPLATVAAACLVVVLAALWRLPPGQQMQMDAAMEKSVEANDKELAAGTARSGQRSQTGDAFSGAAAMMASAPVRMTVRVVEQREDGLLVQVVDPGSSDFQPEEQVTVLLPEAWSADLPEEGALFTVSFFPGQEEDAVIALEWAPAEQ